MTDGVTATDGVAATADQLGWRIEVDGRRCAGSGTCAASAPQFFELRDGVSAPVTEHVTEHETVLAAAEICPLEAISVTELRTGARIAPV
jgi:ferredoxin